MSEAPYQLHLQMFEGPFDLLLHLIRENQVDIYDIPIAEITAQYLAYLQTMEALDLEIASSFIVMAATLLAIKAKMLLPPAETEDGEAEPEDARQELVHDLLEYLRFKEAAQGLETLYATASQQYARPNAEELYVGLFEPENPLDGKTLADLSAAFAEVLRRLEGREQVLDIAREQVTIQDKARDIHAALRKQPRGLPFSNVFRDCHSRIECVTAFLALLELIRQAQIRVSQGGEYEEIFLFAVKGVG